MALFNLNLSQIRDTTASNGASNPHVSAKPPSQRSLPTIPEDEDTIASATNKTITMPPSKRARHILLLIF